MAYGIVHYSIYDITGFRLELKQKYISLNFYNLCIFFLLKIT